jgi:hypothetical protein
MPQTFNYNKPAFESPLLSADVRRNFQALVTSNAGPNPPSPAYDGMWWSKTATRELYFHMNSVWTLFATYNTTISQWQVASGDAAIVTAGEPLNGGRAIFIDTDGKAYKADKDSLSEVRGILGINPGAISIGTTGIVKFLGMIVDPVWSWATNGVIYCGADGVLTQTPPATGNVRRIGVAFSATSLVVSLGETLALT